MKQYTLLFSLLLLAGCATSPGIDFPKKFGSYPALQPSKEAPPANEIVTDQSKFQTVNSLNDEGGGRQFTLSEKEIPADPDNLIFDAETHHTFWLKLSDNTYYKISAPDDDPPYQDTGLDLFAISNPVFGYSMRLLTRQDLRTFANGDKAIICCGGGKGPAMNLQNSFYGLLIPKDGTPQFLSAGMLSDEKYGIPSGTAIYDVVGLRAQDGKAVTTAYQPVRPSYKVQFNILKTDTETIKNLEAQGYTVKPTTYKLLVDTPEKIKGKIKLINEMKEWEKLPQIGSTLEANFDTKTVTGTLQGNQDYGPEVRFDHATITGNKLTGTVTSDGQTGTLKGGFYGGNAAEIGGIIHFEGRQDLDTAFGGTKRRTPKH